MKNKINPKQKKEFKTIWRPTQMTPETIQKLRDWFCYSCTDTEACLYAWISTTTFYNWLDKNEAFREEKEMLKKKVSMKAKFNMAKSINQWDRDDSKRWLPRKSKDEFSERSETTGKDWMPIAVEAQLSQEQMEKIAQNILESHKHLKWNEPVK